MKLKISFVVLFQKLGCTRIDTGNIGVEKIFGQIKADELTPGLYMTLFKTVIEVSGKESALSMVDLKPKAKENLTMQDFDFDIYYRINPTFAADLITKYSGDMLPNSADDGSVDLGVSLLTRHAREAAYNAVVKHEFAEIQNRRAEISTDIEQSLQKELDAKTIKGAFVITNVVIKNITTDSNLEKSIREAADVEFQVRKKQEEIRLSQAESDRLLVEAKGIAAANNVISSSLTPTLIKLREIEMTEKFSANQNVTLLLGNTGVTPMMQLK